MGPSVFPYPVLNSVVPVICLGFKEIVVPPVSSRRYHVTHVTIMSR